MTFTSCNFVGRWVWLAATAFIVLATFGSRQDFLAYGPDLSGRYGGMNGVGGLETITTTANGSSTTEGILSDAFGNVLGGASGSGVAWNPSRVGLYGPVEGRAPARVSLNVPLHESLAWRTRPANVTGLVQLGVRPYDPARRAFLSADPLGHASDAALNTAFAGNPAAYFDADGRCAAMEAEFRKAYSEYVASASPLFYYNGDEPALDISPVFRDFNSFVEDMVQGALKGDYAREAGPGAGFGNALSSSLPGWGTIAGVRDLSASAGDMGNGGWRRGGNWRNLGLNAVAAVPFFGWVKAGAKAEHAGAEMTKAVKAAEGAERGGLNLFRAGPDGLATRGAATGWREGGRMLNLPNQGSPKLNWKQNAGRLREEMGRGEPIFDSYRAPATGLQIPVGTTPTSGGRFLNAERKLLESRGWKYNPSTGAYHPPGS